MNARLDLFRLFPSTSARRRFLPLLLLALSLGSVKAHDPTELTTGVFVRSNSLEVRVTIAASTATLLLEADGHSDLSLTTPDGFDKARPLLQTCAADLFRISAAGKILTALETNVSLSVEDHIEMKLIYPRPVPGKLRLDAFDLKKLPTNERYGALVTAVDMPNKLFLGQRLLTADAPTMELKITAPPLTEAAVTIPELRSDATH